MYVLLSCWLVSTWYLSIGRAILQACAVHLIAATDWRRLLHEVRELLLPIMRRVATPEPVYIKVVSTILLPSSSLLPFLPPPPSHPSSLSLHPHFSLSLYPRSSLHPSPRLQRLALILLVLHYSVEFLFHTARLLHYHGKEEIATPG